MRVPLSVSAVSPVLERRLGDASYLASGLNVRVFARGANPKTDPPAAVYSAEEGGVVIAQPLVTDRAGRIMGSGGEECWVEAGFYDLVFATGTAPWQTGEVARESPVLAQGPLTEAEALAALARAGVGAVLFETDGAPEADGSNVVGEWVKAVV